MGVLLKDPDVDVRDIYWYNALAKEIFFSQMLNENKKGFITKDEKHETYSYYVELHRNGFNCKPWSALHRYLFSMLFKTINSHPVGINGRNNIIVPTPMEFLPIVEFEKHQKSINSNQTRALMSAMITKIEF